MVYSRLTIYLWIKWTSNEYLYIWIKWTSNFYKQVTFLRGVVECILTILSQCQKETYKLKMFRRNAQAVFMQPIVILLLVILQLVVQSIVSDAGVFLRRRKLRVCIRIPVATIYDAQHREILVSRNSGTRKKNDRGGGGGRILRLPSCPLWLSPTLRCFSHWRLREQKIWALKETAWECKFWFVLV